MKKKRVLILLFMPFQDAFFYLLGCNFVKLYGNFIFEHFIL